MESNDQLTGINYFQHVRLKCSFTNNNCITQLSYNTHTHDKRFYLHNTNNMYIYEGQLSTTLETETMSLWLYERRFLIINITLELLVSFVSIKEVQSSKSRITKSNYFYMAGVYSNELLECSVLCKFSNELLILPWRPLIWPE